jgi:iron complex outermembrane receptor protein
MPRCGFIIIILLGHFNFIFAEQNSSLALEPIVITKSKTHLLKTYSLATENFPNLPITSPIEALAQFPLDLQSRLLKAGIQTDFSLRGSNFQGVLLLINGQRINDPQTGHHNSDIPLTLEDIKSIEVIPGVSSSLFGPDAIGGAVNFILKKPKEKKRVFATSFGQHRMSSELFSITEKINDLGIRFSQEYQESDGFGYDTDFKKFNTAFASTLDIPDGEFDLNFGYQEKEFGAYDFYTPGLGYPSKEWTKTYLLNASLILDKAGFVIKPNFLWRRHFDKFMLDKTQNRSRYLNHHRTDIYTSQIYLQKETDILGRVGLGLEFGEERINSTNLSKHNRHHKSIFMDVSEDLNAKVSLGDSLRIDDFDGFGYVYTGSASLRYKLASEHCLHFGISRSMRVPSFTELYYNDPTTVGDPGLSAEKAWNYQAGYDYQKEGLSLGTVFFLREENDFIDWVKSSAGQAKWEAKNLTESKIFGIENYLRLSINQNLALDSNYTYIDKRSRAKDYLFKYGPNYVRHLINNSLNFNLPFGIQTLKFTYKKKPLRDGWFLLDAHLSYNLNKNSQIFLHITNLLNVEYQEIEGIPQPGRWIEAGIRLDW